MLKYLFTILYILVFSQTNFSQQCFEYHKDCPLPSSKFVYSETKYSVSFLFDAGNTKQTQLPLFSGKDYRITICADSVFNQVVNFKLINNQGKVLYDNSKDNYSLTLEFISKQTQNALLEITIPDMINPNGSVPKGCVGIRIEDMVSVRLGF